MSNSSAKGTVNPGDQPRVFWDQEMTDVDVLDIVETFKLTDLDDVYIHLGLTHIDIENTKLRDTHRPEKQAQNILNLWRDRNGKKASRKEFIEAVAKCINCRASMDQLKRKWNTSFDGPSTSRKTEATHPGVSEPSFDGPSTSTKREKTEATHPVASEPYEETPPITPEVDTFKNELIEHYKREMGQLPLLPWLEEEDEPKHIDDIFVELELAMRERRNTEPKKIDNYEDLVTLEPPETNKVDKYAKRILVLGDAGSGKTSLMSKIAYSWSLQNHPSLNKFELVLHLRMRDLHSCNNVKHCLRRGTTDEEEPDTDCSLLGEVFQQMPETDVNVCDLQNYIKLNPTKVLILLDGWDESVLSHVDLEKSKVKKTEHDIENLLTCKKQISSCVIVTSRPYKYLGGVQVKHYTSVILKGFSQQNVGEYIRKFFQDEHKSGALINHLNTSDILLHLAKIPVMLMMICWMWGSDLLREKLAKQKTKLYNQFVSAIWARYCKKEHCSKFESEISELCNLGKIALEGLSGKEDILIFEKCQLKVSPDIGLKLGLLIEEKDISRHSLSRNVKCISFLHKSFQEYCAAYFLVNKPDMLDNFLKSLDNWNAVLSKQEVLLFCCGLCSIKFPGNDAAVNIVKHAIACCVKYGTESKCSEIRVGNGIGHTRAQYNILPVLNLLNECGHFNHEALNKPLRDLIMFNKLSILNTNPQTLPVFHQCVTSKLGSSLCNIQTVIFDYHPCASLDVISDTLRCMPSVSDVNIKFSDGDTGVASESSMTQLGESIAALSKLSSLAVWNARNRLNMSVILQHLSRSPSKTLTDVDFNDTHVGDAISHMGGIIPHLVVLSLWYASLDDEHITALCNILPNATCLERLNLIGNPNIGNNGLHILFTHLHHCVRLTRLSITATIDCHYSPLVKECVTAASRCYDADYKRIPAGEDIPVEACEIRLVYQYDATQSLLSISRNAATKSTDSQKPRQT